MNQNNICVFDFETDSPDPNEANPTEIASVIIHPRTLEIIPGSEFSSFIKPPTIDNEDYISQHKKTIDWHCKTQNISQDELLNKWKNAPNEKDVFNQFVGYLLKYNTNQNKRSQYTAPIAAGHNIIKFDIPIIDRLSKKYGQLDSKGQNKLFNYRIPIDSLLITFLWFENNSDMTSYALDNLRKYFGLSTKGAHTAIADVRQNAELICRFLKLHRNCAEKVRFK